MYMIYEKNEVVDAIKIFINKKRDEKNIVNAVLQDDVFELLSMDCKLLYYPLDDTIKGIHLEKIIAGKVFQFVYINTKKKVEEQTWTAAHELGHVWKVDKYVCEHVKESSVKVEDIVNRFAAELLMPEEEFVRAYKYAMKKWVLTSSLKLDEFIRLVSYLMNYFCVPYKAVIYRMVELGIVSKENEQKYITTFENEHERYEQIIKEYYYTKLDLTKESCSMEEISHDIDLLEKNNLVNKNVIDRYREAFRIITETESAETFDFGGYDGE